MIFTKRAITFATWRLFLSKQTYWGIQITLYNLYPEFTDVEIRFSERFFKKVLFVLVLCLKFRTVENSELRVSWWSSALGNIRAVMLLSRFRKISAASAVYVVFAEYCTPKPRVRRTACRFQRLLSRNAIWGWDLTSLFYFLIYNKKMSGQYSRLSWSFEDYVKLCTLVYLKLYKHYYLLGRKNNHLFNCTKVPFLSLSHSFLPKAQNWEWNFPPFFLFL